MYKPDPRLPPDQQILPTHAKKLQQEQWQREGKLPSAYDRAFEPLAIRDEKDEGLSEEAGKGQTDEVAATPPSLPTPTSPDVNKGPNASGTNRNTIPNVRASLQSPQQTIKTKPVETPPAEKEKGCGCCIIM
jgi:hypothetical protein